VAGVVEADEEDVRPAREAARRVVRDVDAAGPSAVGGDGQLPHRVAQALDGLRRRRGRGRQLGDLQEERVERLGGGGVEVVGDARELGHERARAAREASQRVRRLGGIRRELERARDELPGSARGVEPPRTGLRTAGRGGGVGVLVAAMRPPLGTLEEQRSRGRER
jgi:hypothetical protein